MKRYFLLMVAVVLIGCERATVPERYYNIERVFMHAPGAYSFLYRKDGMLVDSGMTYNCKLFDDVPDGQPMWAKVNGDWSYGCSAVWFDIHVHSVKEIGGGEYQAGKMLHLQTVPVQ